MKKKSTESLDDVWTRIFKHYGIPSHVAKHGYLEITAKELKQFHEPRLLCKIDFEEKRPTAFKKSGLSILATKNGLYKIAPTNPFFKISLTKLASKKIIEKTLPLFISTIDPDNISSESQALDAAAASGILDDYIGEKTALTIRGRRRSSAFSFSLSTNSNPMKYDIEGVQIEIDGGYEGAKSLLLVEAKNSVSKSMNLRQVLYPQIHFEKEVSKIVKSTVLFYDRSVRVFNFIPLLFSGSTVSPDYKNVKRYRLKSIKPTHDDKNKLNNFLKSDVQLTNNSAPFPQANDITKVLSAFDKICEKSPIHRDEVYEDLAVPVVGRQYKYYNDVLVWMGLITDTKSVVELTERGESLSNLEEINKLRAFEKIIFSDPLAKEMAQVPANELTSKLLSSYGLSGSTPARRQSTIKSWKLFFDKNKKSFGNLI